MSRHALRPSDNPSGAAETTGGTTSRAGVHEATCVAGMPMHSVFWHPPRVTDLPPVVLVHGFVISSAYMVPTGERLGRHTAVHALDLPGFGHSEGPRRSMSVVDLAEALHAWLWTRQIDRPVLLGNSFGCQVVVHAAARHPDTVAGLVLTSPTLPPDARSLRGVLPRLAREQRTHSKALRRTMLRSYLQAGPRRIVGTARHALRDRIEDALPRVKASTLVLRGTGDPITDAAWAQEVTQLLPHGRLQTIEDGDHALTHEQPDQLTDAVRHFLTELDPSPQGVNPDAPHHPP